MLVPDGAWHFVKGKAHFHGAPAPSDADIVGLLARLIRRATRCLLRADVLVVEAEQSSLDVDTAPDDALAGLAAHNGRVCDPNTLYVQVIQLEEFGAQARGRYAVGVAALTVLVAINDAGQSFRLTVSADVTLSDVTITFDTTGRTTASQITLTRSGQSSVISVSSTGFAD